VWVVTLGVVSLAAQSRDPFVGTWHFNAAKSTFGNPATAFKESTITIQAFGNGQKVVVDTISGRGQHIEYEFTAAFDGKDYPITGVAPGTVTLKRIDDRTIERIHKNDGKQTLVFLTRVSPDGKILMLTQTGTGPQGQPVKNTILYEKK
jgi:hypothetical protein